MKNYLHSIKKTTRLINENFIVSQMCVCICSMKGEKEGTKRKGEIKLPTYCEHIYHYSSHLSLSLLRFVVSVCIRVCVCVCKRDDDDERGSTVS